MGFRMPGVSLELRCGESHHTVALLALGSAVVFAVGTTFLTAATWRFLTLRARLAFVLRALLLACLGGRVVTFLFLVGVVAVLLCHGHLRCEHRPIVGIHMWQ